ncbi:MAG TPA: hypothetical protein VN889_05025 [Solirubrobacteraceae bacterium]|nr:hypothetical protein [Solirubrobacteraceae bacterium]
MSASGGASTSPSSGSSSSRSAAGKAAAPPATITSLYPTAERIPSDASGGLLGFSGSNLLDMLCGVVVLVLVGALFVRLARPAPER